MNDNYLYSLNNAIRLFNKSRLDKMKEASFRLIFSLLLEKISSSINIPIKINTTTFWNEKMLVVFPEIVSIQLYRYGFFEEGLTNIFLKYIKPGMVLFDIGGHFGYFALLGSFLAGDKGKVHVFEPTPSTFEILKINTQSKLNIKLNNYGVSNTEKYVQFNDFGLRYSAFNTLYKAKLDEKILKRVDVTKYNIKCISIDEYIINNNVIPDIIKIDAESSEYDILLGMQETFEKVRPIITMEVGDYNNDNHSNKIIEFVQKKGYKILEYNNGNIQEANATKLHYKYDNILLVPN